jgi:adenine-specific DNA methylase
MMTVTAPAKTEIVPFSLKDAPSLIEKAWPTAKISAETQKERKANLGQTLTALGSYWKGRKMLVLNRACILASLMPATEDLERDVEIFEKLMGMADETFGRRFVGGPSAFAKLFPQYAETVATGKDLEWKMSVRDGDGQALEAEKLLSRMRDEVPDWVRRDLESFARGEHPQGDPKEFVAALPEDWSPFIEEKHRRWTWRDDITEQERERRITRAFMTLPYATRIEKLKRPEELPEGDLLAGVWDEVNAHLGTDASSITELVGQLGLKRFGRRPKIADTFSGSGQIPFEAARMGCEAYASDLNPVACMLTWGNFNIVGADQASQDAMTSDQERLVQEIDQEIRDLGIEHDSKGNRAKVYLYCLETRCPRTGYMVPMAPSFVISRRRDVVAKLVPNHQAKRYDFEIIMGASDEELREAALGTSRSGRLFHPLLDDELGVSIKEIRGDYKDENGANRNRLRFWEKSDFKPRPDDIWQERLYAIQWMDAKDLEKGKANPRTWFAAPTEADLDRERLVEEIVEQNLSAWQEAGLVPDMEIEHGNETTRLMRERGWTHWHHLYTPRSLLLGSMVTSRYKADPRHFLNIAIFANRMARTVDWHSGEEAANHTFTNQAINTMQNYPVRGFTAAKRLLVPKYFCTGPVTGHVKNAPSNEIGEEIDIFLTDPPYADAVQYDEITEFFIAWLRKNPPAPFNEWIWDSRRNVAIKGDGQPFKAAMVETYGAMTDHMVDHGLQIVQFTHQDTKTWSDMAQIFWGAGLQVVQDWYVSTENMTELKKGGYVQGTHMIVLRKRRGEQSGYQDEIVHEIRDEVERQIREMIGLNDQMDAARGENIFNDADLQMAGYAAALRVLTAYTKIDGVDMTREALRPRKKGEKTLVDELTEFAVQTANEFLVPEGLDRDLWLELNGAERFYLKMTDIEEAGEAKLDQFQNFAKAFRVGDYDDMMASKSPNNAKLKTAIKLGKTSMAEGIPFGRDSIVRLALRGIWRVAQEDEVDEVLEELRELIPDYLRKRDTLRQIIAYVAAKREHAEPDEASAARILGTAIQTERI